MFKLFLDFLFLLQFLVFLVVYQQYHNVFVAVSSSLGSYSDSIAQYRKLVLETSSVEDFEFSLKNILVIDQDLQLVRY